MGVRIRRLAQLAFLLLSCVFLLGCSRSSEAVTAPAPPPKSLEEQRIETVPQNLGMVLRFRSLALLFESAAEFVPLSGASTNKWRTFLTMGPQSVVAKSEYGYLASSLDFDRSWDVVYESSNAVWDGRSDVAFVVSLPLLNVASARAALREEFGAPKDGLYTIPLTSETFGQLLCGLTKLREGARMLCSPRRSFLEESKEFLLNTLPIQPILADIEVRLGLHLWESFELEETLENPIQLLDHPSSLFASELRRGEWINAELSLSMNDSAFSIDSKVDMATRDGLFNYFLLAEPERQSPPPLGFWELPKNSAFAVAVPAISEPARNAFWPGFAERFWKRAGVEEKSRTRLQGLTRSLLERESAFAFATGFGVEVMEEHPHARWSIIAEPPPRGKSLVETQQDFFQELQRMAVESRKGERKWLADNRPPPRHYEWYEVPSLAVGLPEGSRYARRSLVVEETVDPAYEVVSPEERTVDHCFFVPAGGEHAWDWFLCSEEFEVSRTLATNAPAPLRGMPVLADLRKAADGSGFAYVNPGLFILADMEPDKRPSHAALLHRSGMEFIIPAVSLRGASAKETNGNYRSRWQASITRGVIFETLRRIGSSLSSGEGSIGSVLIPN